MTQREKWWGLGGLVVLWAALIYVYILDVPPPQVVPLKYKSGGAVAGSVQKGSAEQWEVQSLHAQSRKLPTAPKKNIFAAAPVPLSPEAQAKLIGGKNRQKPLAAATAAVPEPPPAPPPPSPEDMARQQEELAAQAARQQEELRRKQLQEQMAQYRYLGYLNQSGVQKAFLGKGREIYILRQGETLDGKFVVASIEAAAVRIMESASKLETTLKLKKEEAAASGT